MVKTIKNLVDTLDPQLIDFCQRVIRIPSLSGDEEKVSHVYMDEMLRLGYDEVFRDDWGNVVGLIHGSEDGPVIMYNGHMDVVTEGDAIDWNGYDPYGAQIDDSMIYNWSNEKEELTKVIHGRGASDMKCGLAAQVYTGAALVKLREMGYKWKGTFMLAAVVLEENGEMMGTIKLTEETLPAKGINVDAMVCAEPSSLRLTLGHRGRMEIKVTVMGRSCHGSSPWLGINAVEKAAKLIAEVNKRITVDAVEDPHLGRSGIALTIIECEPCALCIVPDKCHIVYDRRLTPGETVEGAIAEIQEIVDELASADPEFSATVSINSNQRSAYTGKSEPIESQKPVWIIDREHPFIKACADGLETVGEEVHYGYWPFSTDIPQLGTIMNKPAVGYSGTQEYYVHNPIEMARLDYLKRSLAGNISMYLKISELPKESFTTL